MVIAECRACASAVRYSATYNGQNSAASAGSIVLSIMAKAMCSAATGPIAKTGIEGKDAFDAKRA
ncbi:MULTISPECIES: hypothetical protein [unclassified Mesorhizobium]|uniref:hypothetical protein n=1 Tax=unclassified Mesorhizobium TaxID=325217 RepID=UPI0011265669|nr:MULTISPECIES: hypothetical protein [unclassified Mesorhizobium]TPL00613.1 hypothetical protein FJ567_13730 [Mesorhizobium sp. B2-4-16]TPL63646.1 hypothetical protein FJ956_23120 [Mesorhizobium sp. B2-4-3]